MRLKQIKTASLIIIIFLLFISPKGYSCTNVIITKNASFDGSTIVSYSADSHDLYGELYHWPAKTYPTGEMLNIYEWDTGKYLGQIKQAAQTYGVVGNINEFQVTIAETTFGGKPELQDSTGILDYGNLMYIALQRSRSAREAIEAMTTLVTEYGYCSTGESYSIADPNEAWIMEIIGKGGAKKGAVWVAVKIPDGMVSAHANQARITTFDSKDIENCISSPDVVSFAKEMKYYDGKEKNFSFADAYAPLDFEAIRFCEARVWSAFRLMNKEAMETYNGFVKGESTKRIPLYIQPAKKISIRDVMAIMRDHYDGTELDMTIDSGSGSYQAPYRFRPLTWKVNDSTYFHERAIATQQTGFVFVAQMRNWLDNPIGGVLWFGVDDANATVFVPMYCGITSPPAGYTIGNGALTEFTWDSAFWVFNWVANQSYYRYSQMIDDIRKNQKELEDKFEIFQPGIEQAARSIYNHSPQLACQFLTEYSHTQAAITLEKWRKLGQFLFVKHLDGNLHEDKDGVFLKNSHGMPASAKFPGYPPQYYQRIVEETGDKFKIKEFPKKTEKE